MEADHRPEFALHSAGRRVSRKSYPHLVECPLFHFPRCSDLRLRYSYLPVATSGFSESLCILSYAPGHPHSQPRAPRGRFETKGLFKSELALLHHEYRRTQEDSEESIDLLLEEIEMWFPRRILGAPEAQEHLC